MELKIVKRPLQDEHTKPEDIQYPNEYWCVKTKIYRQGDGGMNLWFEEIERINPDIIYLYEIKSWKDKLVVGLDQNDWIDDTFYSVRYAFKKVMGKYKIVHTIVLDFLTPQDQESYLIDDGFVEFDGKNTVHYIDISGNKTLTINGGDLIDNYIKKGYIVNIK